MGGFNRRDKREKTAISRKNQMFNLSSFLFFSFLVFLGKKELKFYHRVRFFLLFLHVRKPPSLDLRETESNLLILGDG